MNAAKKYIHAKAIQVLYNGIPAGILEKNGITYSFTYFTDYVEKKNRPVSITMPVSKLNYNSNILFPVFANLLSEGVNKKMQCRLLKIDETDYFGLLIATAIFDSIGSITVKELNHAD